MINPITHSTTKVIVANMPDLPPLMEHIQEQMARSLNSEIENAIKGRCDMLGYEFHLVRLFCISQQGVGDLWYYRQNDGFLSPLIAFSPMEVNHSEGEYENIGSIKCTLSCRELHPDVFKPKKHEENSNPFRKGL